MAPSEHPPIARLRKLRAVELRVPTLTESADFYAEVWGLEVVDRDQDTAWLRGTGDEHHILGLTRAPRNGLGKLSFAVATREDPTPAVQVFAELLREVAAGRTEDAEPELPADEPG